VPLWASGLTNVSKLRKKYGNFKFKNEIPDTMEHAKLKPLENRRGDVYTGEWRNGIRWGKGVMFWKEGTVYEGTF